MKLYHVKEARGVHAVARFHDEGPYETVALFSTEREAHRFIAATNKKDEDATAAQAEGREP